LKGPLGAGIGRRLGFTPLSVWGLRVSAQGCRDCFFFCGMLDVHGGVAEWERKAW
jgi:hypothetical protein